jgi:hypothetical protein
MTQKDPSSEQPILQNNVGYMIYENKAWYKPTGKVLYKNGVAKLYSNKILVLDENGKVVFEKNLTSLSKFRKSAAAILFNSDNQIVRLVYNYDFKTMVAGAVAGGAAGGLAMNRKGAPVAKQWKSQLQSMGKSFKKFYLGVS